MTAGPRAEWTGRLILRRREELCLTQEMLAEKVGVHQTSISKWEAGLAEVSLRHRRPLARALGISKDDLFEEPPIGWRTSKAAA